MCFGNTANTTGSQTSSTTSAPSWLTGAAQSNLDFAQGVQSSGFQPYTGQQVASFSPQQSSSFGLGSDIAGGVSPYVGETGSLINNYANAGAQSVTPETIASQMSPYMNQYVNQALQPQLQAQAQLNAAQNHSFDSAATGAGAFGDSSWNLGRTNLANQQSIAQQGLVGNAYNAAFNTAIGAGAQDVSNNLSGQTTNANLAETALGRQLAGASALNNVGTGATNLTNTLGAQQTTQQQAQLNAAYNQWQLAQQYPFQTTQLVNSTIGAATPGAGSTTNGTVQNNAVDNSGYGLLGSAAGAFFAADGGAVPAGAPVKVGERGEEVIVPNTNSVIIPNEVLEAARKLRDRKTAAPAPAMNFGIAA